MKILLTNDDGITAPGLAAVANYLQRHHEVFVVAPDNERSGVSQSITFRRPIFHKRVQVDGGINGYAINGYPVDCVKVALFELCPFVPDVVVSGMNAGLNVGLNVGYSGTVAGALAGASSNLPSVALSLESVPTGEPDFDRAMEIAWPICEELLTSDDWKGRVINVNIPTAALTGEARYRIVPTNSNNMGYHFQTGVDPKNRPYHWQTTDPDPLPHDHICDVQTVAEGVISVTPLSFDLTDYRRLEKMQPSSAQTMFTAKQSIRS